MALGDILHQFYSLVEHNLEGSITILGDFLLSNSSEFGLKSCPQHHFKVTIYYADSLYANQHFRRALNYYELGLKVLKQSKSSDVLEGDVNEASVKWRIYKCHMDLKEIDEALTALVKIPQEQRDAKTWIAMAKLFQQVKSDAHSAATCYKQSLRKCPLAMEAVFGLLSLGHSLTNVLSPAMALPAIGFPSNVVAPADPARQHICSVVKKCQWLSEWLEAESMILHRDYSGAVVRFDELTRMGLKLSADGNCQLAFCMEKLGRKESAKELFAIASCQDVHVVNHMDMYARLLALEQATSHRSRLEKLEKICSRLINASCLHSEPWVAQAWLVLSSKDWIANVGAVHRHLKKAITIRPSAEAVYVEGYVYSKLGDLASAATKLSEALRLDNSFYEAYRDLIQCYLKWKPKRAVMNMTQMASKFLPPAQHFYLEGMVWSHYMTTDKAVRVLKKALLQDHSFEDAALLLGTVYCKMGQVKMAAKVLSEQLSATSSACLHSQLARALMQLGQHQDALDHFQRALYLDPELKEAKEGTERLMNSLSPSVGTEVEESISKEEQEGILTPFQAHIIRDGERIVDTRS